ncbi:MAG: UDP-N-acetylglucosamine 2-epimerase (non-hydrolyzing) [Deltaproteobacteria bacterium]|nr:UDP-N-acetylglucosamine 2-epimerase (non-hydrolyzing) [Deltaproteobacteria bacterium]
MNVLLIAGARPNFMKIAPIFHESLKYASVVCRIVHTGQHYDYEMSQAFFEDLDLPEPDFFLGAGSGTHAEQTSKIMLAFEALCAGECPDLVMVVGDVNSTLACSIVAKKCLVQVAHVEAGLRSFDRAMPEEINRMVTDAISDHFFVTEQSAVDNLVHEGKDRSRIHFVGNVMIDNLYYQLAKLANQDTVRFASHGLKETLGKYLFLTLHRPSNVDSEETFKDIAAALNGIAAATPIVFPVHPRTRERLERFRIRFSDRIFLLPPLGFNESLYLWKDAEAVLTDSGGLQEETTALGIPCLTFRENTERPITIELGTNILGGTTKTSILNAFEAALAGRGKAFSVPPKWDGKTSERIWKILAG